MCQMCAAVAGTLPEEWDQLQSMQRLQVNLNQLTGVVHVAPFLHVCVYNIFYMRMLPSNETCMQGVAGMFVTEQGCLAGAYGKLLV